MPVRRRCQVAVMTSVLIASCQGAPNAPYLAASLPLAEQTLTAGQAARRVANVRFFSDSAVVDAPARAVAGVPVSVGVTTYGGGCIAEDTVVATAVGTRMEIVPYQRVYSPRVGEGCTLELRITQRRVRVTFATGGVAQIVVVGRAQPGDSIVQIVRSIAVQ